MGCAMGTVRYILFFFNFLLALAGLGILVLGIITAHTKGATIDTLLKGQVSTPAIIFAIVGACVFIFAFFGCCGAIRESHCMIVTYAILLLTLFLLQVAVAVLAYVYSSQTEDVVKKTIEEQYNNYNKDSTDHQVIDGIQIELHCCGSTDNKTPWATLGIAAPASCYSGNSTSSGKIYDQGCESTIINLIKDSLSNIADVAIAVGIIQVVGIIFSLCLANSIRRAELRGYA